MDARRDGAGDTHETLHATPLLVRGNDCCASQFSHTRRGLWWPYLLAGTSRLVEISCAVCTVTLQKPWPSEAASCDQVAGSESSQT
jgi:hypothetical protein